MADRQTILRVDGMSLCPSSCAQSSTICKIGKTLPCISINRLPHELLLAIFDHCRLVDVFSWNHKRRWYTLLHVCRKWRDIILGSASRLNLRLLCDSATPIAKMLLHSPPLPLVVIFRKYELFCPYEGNTLLALQHSDRVFSISFDHWTLGLLVALNKTFPTLEMLSLISNHWQSLDLPYAFVAPRLRAIHLDDIIASVTSSLLTNAATNLVSVCIEGIRPRP
jgi:hypothetical protein